MKLPSLRNVLVLATSLPAAAGLLVWLGLWPGDGTDMLSLWLRGWALLWIAAILMWIAGLTIGKLLWSVGRRLAFSYFLIGLVPIPLLAILVSLIFYVLAGFYQGYLFRDAVLDLQAQLGSLAARQLDLVLRGQVAEEPPPPDLDVAFTLYRDGELWLGARDAPELWQDWWADARLDARTGQLPVVQGVEGQPVVFGGARSGRFAILARHGEDLASYLSRRTGLWVELARPGGGAAGERVTIKLFGRQYPIHALEPVADPEEIQDHFSERLDPGWLDRPWLVWVELSKPYLLLDGGTRADEYLTATLSATVRSLADHLVPRSPEVGFFVYLLFLIVFLVTFDLYLVALVMAMTMIVGLSRAVNRLSSATQRIQSGDFSTRITVRRRDQVGALQRSFNGMAENLERLVRDAAQKEIWERELSLAHELQRSLLPDTLQAPEPLDFATYFRPSTALGGDYYDVLTLADGRCAVMVADVSGHGLAAGLRMAMVKSAFELLTEEESDPAVILDRLHRLLRDRLQSPNQRRSFVTATVTAINCATGDVEIVNAGHPPTYLLRDGEVTEIELPGSPLGLLSPAFPRHLMTLREGDVLVWLSDGLLEATDRHDDLFGYRRVTETLEGQGTDIEVVRTALLEAVAEHYGDGGHLDDDLTLVVMRWNGVGTTRDVASDARAAEEIDDPAAGSKAADEELVGA